MTVWLTIDDHGRVTDTRPRAPQAPVIAWRTDYWLTYYAWLPELIEYEGGHHAKTTIKREVLK